MFPHVSTLSDITNITRAPHASEDVTVTLDGKPFNGDVTTLEVSTIDHIDVTRSPSGHRVIHIVTKNAARGGRED